MFSIRRRGSLNGETKKRRKTLSRGLLPTNYSVLRLNDGCFPAQLTYVWGVCGVCGVCGVLTAKEDKTLMTLAMSILMPHSIVMIIGVTVFPTGAALGAISESGKTNCRPIPVLRYD